MPLSLRTCLIRSLPALTLTIGLNLAFAPAMVLAQQSAGRTAQIDGSASDAARLHAIVAAQVAAWNVGDAKAFSAPFADDGSFTNIRGSVFYGHQAFEDRHVEIFSTFFKGSKLTMSVTKIRLVRPDVAIADIATEISELGGKTPPGVKATVDGKILTRLQEVFVRTGDDWRIASYHNVDVKQL
jgi:uncharacterized protein (TIGR02246 family)